MIVLTIGAPIGSDDTETCIENYLKKLELVGSEFGDDEGVTSGCNFMIPIIKKEIYKKLESELSKKGENEHRECFMKKLEERDFASTLLALSVYQDTSKVSESVKNEKAEEFGKIMKGQLVMSSMDCKLEHQFSEMFEELVEGDSESDESTPEEDYCARKYVVENELLDSSYKLKLNPGGIDTASLNCEELYPTIRTEAEEALVESFLDSESSGESPFNETTTECAVNVIKGENFIDRLLPFSFLHELELSDAAKENEKSKFIQVMKDFTQALITTCFL
jgi:hypothetical protein